MAPIQQGAFREFKVYDETRRPADWTSLVGPTQCAVFLKDVKTANPLATDGSEIDHLRDCRFLLFDRLEDARAFCEAQVQRYPFMCCEIFDAEEPYTPRGCIAQAWSVAEVLRCWALTAEREPQGTERAVSA